MKNGCLHSIMAYLVRTTIERRHRIMARYTVGNRILDVGFAGAPNRYLGDDKHVVGYDAIEAQAIPGYSEIIKGEIGDIGTRLSGRKFDTILLGEVIEHVEAPYSALRELWRLIDNDGRLILSTPNPLSLPTLFFEFMGSKRFFYTQYHLYYFLPRWVERMLSLTGYTLERIVPVGLYLLPIPVPTSLSYMLVYVAKKQSSAGAPGGIQGYQVSS